jgi:apolipoprotein D and lipocalin family protein
MMMLERQGFANVLCLFFAVWLLSGCTGMPENVTVVEGFDSERYLGRWYEIARLDHSFERGLSHVTATYTRRRDGGIEVRNRGYDMQSGEWREALGKAYPLGEAGQGRLKVSFFGPFYGSYNILMLDHEAYAYALVAGPDRDFLWIMAREPQLAKATLKQLVDEAERLGFDTGGLIYVDHSPLPPR